MHHALLMVVDSCLFHGAIFKEIMILLARCAILLCWMLSLQATFPDIENFLRKPSPFIFKLSGFVRNDVFWDSRQAVSFRQNVLLFAPAEPCYLRGYGDVNNVATFTITPLRSFVRLDLHNAEQWGTEVRGTIQVDCLGINEETTSAIRLWYAYFELIGRYNKIAIGQLRHPLRLLRVFPHALTFNVAEIIAAPQIRWVHKWTEHFHGIAAIHSELVDASFGQLIQNGPIEESPKFIQNSLKPAFAVRVQHATEQTIIGAGYDIRAIVPRLVTATGYATEQEIAASWFTAFAGVKTDSFDLRWQSLVGQNTTPANLLGGAALSCCATPTNKCTYTNLWAATHWIDLEITRHPVVHPGAFLGYSPVFHVDNRLFIDPVTNRPVIFTFNDRLQMVLRAAVRVTGEWEPIKMGIEYVFAHATYGDRDAAGKVVAPQSVSMGRLLLVSWFYF